MNKKGIHLPAPKETVLTKIERDTYIHQSLSSSQVAQPQVYTIVKFQAKQEFWKQEIRQLLSDYRKMSNQATKILKSDVLSKEIQQTGLKLKLPQKMLKICNLMESKILSVEMEIEKNTPKYDSYNPHQFKESNVDFLNLKYKNAKVFMKFGYDQLKEVLVKYGLFNQNSSDVEKQK